MVCLWPKTDTTPHYYQDTDACVNAAFALLQHGTWMLLLHLDTELVGDAEHGGRYYDLGY